MEARLAKYAVVSSDLVESLGNVAAMRGERNTAQPLAPQRKTLHPSQKLARVEDEEKEVDYEAKIKDIVAQNIRYHAQPNLQVLDEACWT